VRLEHSHHPDAVRARIEAAPRPSYVRDWIYGGIDGAVTTFAVVAGVVGADLSARVVLILGFANLLADGFSMAASNYSGTKAERDDYRRLRAVEEKHLDLAPEGEREEIRAAFRAKGFEGAELERVVDVITADRRRWVETMMVEEYGLGPAERSATKAAAATFAAFVLCGLVPLLPWLAGTPFRFEAAVALTGLVFFAIGSAKSRWSTQRWWWSGAETFAIGMSAAAIAYAVGYLLRGIGGGA
jgi:VIT1/CCC1 family predicted Fe2+/Mn2+ transporter